MRTADNGPRFYSLHRQFGYAPDPTRSSSAPKDARSADPLPSGFFAAAGPAAEDAADEAEDAVVREPVKSTAKKRRK
jgi:hypothetical protein